MSPRSTRPTDDARTRLLDAAARLLHSEGPGALSVRRLAEAVGTSTQAIYTGFGGKGGLVSGLYREGFARLEQAMAAVPITADPVADLVALGHAYRACALANPHFYDVMFGRAVPGFECDDDDRAVGLSTFALLVAGVERALAAGAVAGAADRIAAHLWICVHGHVSLELSGFLDSEAHPVEWDDTLRGSLAPFLTGSPPASR